MWQYSWTVLLVSLLSAPYEPVHAAVSCTDCVGNDCSSWTHYIGDGYCDDGTWGLYYDCLDFWYDGGDCTMPTSTCAVDAPLAEWLDCPAGTVTDHTTCTEGDSITCYENEIVKLDIQFREDLTGTVPQWLCSLTSLRYIHFWATSLSGSLPDCLPYAMPSLMGL